MNQPLEPQQIDIPKLIAAVRGSQAARVLFEYRSRDGAELFHRQQSSAPVSLTVADVTDSVD
jgi:hypothetical protein